MGVRHQRTAGRRSVGSTPGASASLIRLYSHIVLEPAPALWPLPAAAGTDGSSDWLTAPNTARHSGTRGSGGERTSVGSRCASVRSVASHTARKVSAEMALPKSRPDLGDRCSSRVHTVAQTGGASAVNERGGAAAAAAASAASAVRSKCAPVRASTKPGCPTLGHVQWCRPLVGAMGFHTAV